MTAPSESLLCRYAITLLVDSSIYGTFADEERREEVSFAILRSS